MVVGVEICVENEDVLVTLMVAFFASLPVHVFLGLERKLIFE